MRIGVVFPTNEFGNDPEAIRAFTEKAEAVGYDHIVLFDHVLGADSRRTDRPRGPYSHETAFHEPFVLMGFMAALTRRIEFTTAVIISPQRQTALLAKQVAELDVVSGGRIRLGIGTGHNKVEYDGLGMDFHTRGRRQEEQVELMRRLWTEDSVRFDGRWDRVDDAGILPRPVGRVPIWFGGHDDIVLKRMARLGDGWIQNRRPSPDMEEHLQRLDGYLAEHGRKRSADDFGLEGICSFLDGDPDRARRQVESWVALDATHVSVNLMSAGITSPEGFIAAAEHWIGAVRDVARGRDAGA